jgi:hypothetical protein
MTAKKKYKIMMLADRDVEWNSPKGIPRPTCVTILEGLSKSQRVIKGLQAQYPMCIWWMEIFN